MSPKAEVLSLGAGIFKALYLYKLEFHLNKCAFRKILHLMEKTSDTRSQYCCRRVGRGFQNPAKPQSPPLTDKHTQKVSKTLVFPLFDSIITNGPTDQRINGSTDQRTNGPTDKASYRVACPQLKRDTEKQRLNNKNRQAVNQTA